MTLADAIAHLYHPSEHDEIARLHGWVDMEQMRFYEAQDEEAPLMTDREVEELQEREESVAAVEGTVEYLAPPPSEILVLARQDSREVYTDSEDCPRDGDFEAMTDWQDLTGVY